MGYLFAAYAVVWLIFFVYVFSLDRKQKAISKEMALLNARVSKTER